MACEKCDYKGFIEDTIIIHSGEKPFIRQCKACDDIEAYSRRVLLGMGEVQRFSFQHDDRVINVNFKKRKRED